MSVPSSRPTGFEHGFGQFFHKQRDAIGPCDNAPAEFIRHIRTARQIGYHERHLFGIQRSEGKLELLWTWLPGRYERWAMSQERKTAGRGERVEGCIEPGDGGWIGPVQVFDHQHHRLLGCASAEHGEKGRTHPLAQIFRDRLRCRRVGGQSEQQRQEPGLGRSCKAVARQHAVELCTLAVWVVIALKPDELFEQVNQRVEAGVLEVGRAVALEPDNGSGIHLR